MSLDAPAFDAPHPADVGSVSQVKPPHSLEAEREVLSAVLIDPNAIDAIADALKPRDFYFERHQAICRVMLEINHRGAVVDMITLRQGLIDFGQFERIGGQQALGELLDRAGSVANLGHYIAIVRGKSRVREWLDTVRAIEVKALQDVHDVDAFVTQAIRTIEAVQTSTMPPPTLGLKSLAEAGLQGWLHDDPPPADSLLTWTEDNGYAKHLLVPAGCVSLLAAAGGTGKSWLLVALAVSIATGKQFLGTYDVPTPGRVLLALGEEDADEMQRRIWAVVHAVLGPYSDDSRADYELAAANIVPKPMMGEEVAFLGKDGLPTPFHAALVAELGKAEYRAALIDPLSRFGGPDIETDAYAATRVIQLCEQLTKGPGHPSVVLAHHTKKVTLTDDEEPTQALVRGHSAIVDGPRCVLFVASLQQGEVRKGRCRLYTVKGNRGPKPGALNLLRGKGGVLRPMTSAEVARERELEAEAIEASRKTKAKRERPVYESNAQRLGGDNTL